MKVIIPAAGYATRLYPLTKNMPKHLLEVRGKPIIEHVINKTLELEEVDEIIIITNDKYFLNFQQWVKDYSGKVPVKIVNDGTISNDDRLGQIGDIQFAIDEAKIDDDLLIIAGDNLFNFSLRPLHKYFKTNQTNINALYDVKSKEDASQLGVATIDHNNKVIKFQEKPKEPETTLISMGIYLFPKQNVSMISKYLDEGNKPDKMGYFMEWLLANNEIYSHVYEEKWFDIGWLESLEQARRDFMG